MVYVLLFLNAPHEKELSCIRAMVLRYELFEGYLCVFSPNLVDIKGSQIRGVKRFAAMSDDQPLDLTKNGPNGSGPFYM